MQSEPLVIGQSKDQTVVHEGDVFAGLQSVLFAGDESRPTVSISYVRRVHTGVAPELDVGTFRQSTSILLSEDIKGFHFDTNVASQRFTTDCEVCCRPFSVQAECELGEILSISATAE